MQNVFGVRFVTREGNTLVATILFDHKSIVLQDRVPLYEVKPLTEKITKFAGQLICSTRLATPSNASATFTNTLVTKTSKIESSKVTNCYLAKKFSRRN